MKFRNPTAQVFVPDGLPPEAALARTTHLAVVAHQDDAEILAVHGILECFRRPDRWFCAVVMTDGRGSPRSGLYQDYTDEEMRAVRIEEQKKAAVVGEYGALVLLDYPSAVLKDGRQEGPVADLVAVFRATRPEVVYTHNLADKHPTHVAVALRTIQALRALPAPERPRHLYGCEVWRDLDWLPDEDKVILDVSARESLQMALLGVHDSQVAGGKRYDLATMGRRRAHATYSATHEVDVLTGATFAMDLTPLIEDPNRDVGEYVRGFIDRFAREVAEQLGRMA